MTGHGEKLTRKLEAAIAALLTSVSVEAAAKSLGIGEKTLRRWTKLPAFQAAYRAARQEVMEGAILKAQQAANEAVDALKRNLKCDKPEAVNQAAKIIIDVGFRGSELMDLQARLEALEGRQHEHGDADKASESVGTDMPGELPPDAEPPTGDSSTSGGPDAALPGDGDEA